MTNPTDAEFAAAVADLLGEGTTPEAGSGFWLDLHDELSTPTSTFEARESSDGRVIPIGMRNNMPDQPDGQNYRTFAAAAIAVLVAALAGWFLLADRTGAGEITTTSEGSSEAPGEDPLGWVRRLSADRSIEPVLLVESGIPTYARLGVLPEFDGRSWRAGDEDFYVLESSPFDPLGSPGSSGGPAAVGTLGDDGSAEYRPEDGGVSQFSTTTDFSILEPDVFGPWLPAPFRTFVFESLDGSEPPVEPVLDPTSYTWQRSEVGPMSYRTQPQRVLPDLLRFIALDSEREDIPGDRELDVPDGVDDELGQRVVGADAWRRLGEGVTTEPYIQAVELERLLRTNYRYAPDSASVVGVDGIEALITTGSGSAEQFATTYAMLARTLRLPSRLVYGFEPGEVVEGAPTQRIVRRSDAHVWVEVFAGDWVRLDPTPGRGLSTALPTAPIANRDHWHALYGVWDCRRNDWAPAFQSTLDPLGIHSHQDGIIHIHPFFEEAAGEQAVLGHFLDSMDVAVVPVGLSEGPAGVAEGSVGLTLPATATCDGEPAQLHLRRWDSRTDLATSPPTIVTDDYAAQRFMADGEVYIFALAPLDAELPDLPAKRIADYEAITGTG